MAGDEAVPPTRPAPGPAVGGAPAGPMIRRVASQAAAEATARVLTWREHLAGDRDFVRRVLIVLAIATLAWFVSKILTVLLLVFAAVLLAVLLRGLARTIAAYTPISDRWSLATGVSLLIVLIAGFVYMFGRQLSGQISNIAESLPFAINNASKELGLGDLLEQLPQLLGGGPGGSLVGTVASTGQRVIGALADVLLVIVAGIYLAAEPRLYRDGFVKLFPKSQHDRIKDALETSGTALLKWFQGQLVSMALVGLLSALAYWFIGLPGFLGLALIAGLTNFIPFLGPILGALPALLIAFTLDTEAVLWTIGAILVIQQLESNVILPLVEKRAVSLPPALALFAIVAFGVMFGFMGLFLAVPLTVVAYVLVKKLWVRQTLGEQTSVPGEEEATR